MPTTLPKRPIVALYGPTSSGKTALAVEFCLRLADLDLRPMVVSADSRQIYTGMDIGTSKTTGEEMRGIPHVMIDVADPIRKLELEQYVEQARGRVEHCLASGGQPVIVGGTHTYVRALLEGWQVEEVGSARRALRRDFPRSMVADAYQTLVRLDRQAARCVHRNNYDQIINALARAMAGPDHGRERAGVRPVVVGLDRPAAVLDRRVARTYDEQVRRGLHEEILALDARYGLQDQYRRLGRGAPNQMLHTHGYTEWFEVAAERGTRLESLTNADLDEIRSRAVQRIQAHTRRQRAAFRKLPGLKMIKNVDQIVSTVAAYLPSLRPSCRG